jgi:hypothetical protein
MFLSCWPVDSTWPIWLRQPLWLHELCLCELKLNACFKVCKSVHHHTIQINHLLDATVSPVYYLTFIYSSTCFGHPHDHHQELNNCSSSLWSWSGQLARPWPTALLSPRSEGKTRGCYCSWAPDDGHEDPETCWAVNKCQVINWRNCCI